MTLFSGKGIVSQVFRVTGTPGRHVAGMTAAG